MRQWTTSKIGAMGGIAGAALILALAPGRAPAAPFFDAGIHTPALAQPVVCTNVRQQVLLPNGQYRYVTRQDCTNPNQAGTAGSGGHSGSGVRCRIERQRIVRPGQNGSSYINVQRCS